MNNERMTDLLYGIVIGLLAAMLIALYVELTSKVDNVIPIYRERPLRRARPRDDNGDELPPTG